MPIDKRRTLVRLTVTGEQARTRIDKVFALGEAERVKVLGSHGRFAMVLH